MKQSLGIIAAILVGAAFTQPAKADATFDFSFSNISGTVAGTVTGYVVLPNICSLCLAKDVVLTGFPAGLDNTFGGPPIDVTALFTVVIKDSFTITSGAVTGADYSAGDSGNGALRLNDGGVNNVELGADALYTGNQEGSEGITFTAAPSPIPEPNSVILMSIALLAVAFVARKRNARGRSPATQTIR